jgi:hypothetical protein
MATVALTLGIVALGATGMLQTPQVLALLGGATTMKLLDQLTETPETENVKSSNLWFLLRLEQEANAQSRKRKQLRTWRPHLPQLGPY